MYVYTVLFNCNVCGKIYFTCNSINILKLNFENCLKRCNNNKQNFTKNNVTI